MKNYSEDKISVQLVENGCSQEIIRNDESHAARQ